MNSPELPENCPLILVVDDDRFVCQILGQAMEELGYSVTIAENSEQGLALYTQLQPDLVLLNVLMLNCCKLWRCQYEGLLTPILAIANLEDPEAIDLAFEVGATDYITKPISLVVLRHKVRHLLQASQAMVQLQAQTELKKSQKKLQIISEITLKIRQSLQLNEILQTTATELLNLLQTDRVLIFRLFGHGYGQIVVEAIVPDCASVLQQNITDECFGEAYLKKYSQGRIYTINDIEKADIPPCLGEFMQSFGVKAKLVVPILLKQELWGLIIVHQCRKPRDWTNFEIEILQQLANQISIALAQSQLLEDESRQRQELAQSNVELQEFAYIASHDLQEPLRKIQAFGNRLQEKFGEQLGDRGKDYLERMHNAAERMQALINDLLTLSQITTNAQPFARINLNQVTQEVLSDLELRIGRTGGRVEVGDLPTIEADPLQIHQLMQNLISNALKFHRTEIKPIVKVNSRLIELEQKSLEKSVVTLCQITIEDNGIGFDEKYLDRIFSVFQRLHGCSEYEGTGMGLAICRKVAERHGGSITALSTPGQGATFIVTLPIKQAEEKHYNERAANGSNNSDG